MNINYCKIYLLLLLSLLLSTPLSAQEAKNEKDVIEFNEKVHNFGDVLLSDGPLKCTFSFKNVSSSPIVVYNVVSSCGCTTPDWTREPVKAGESGVINVTFKNDQGPYPFDKSLTVYVSGLNRPAVLRIRGIVHEKSKSVAELYTVHFGKLGLRKKDVAFGYVDQGREKSVQVEVANISKEAIKVSGSSSAAGIFIDVTPNPIPAKGTAVMNLTLDTRKMEAICWGHQELYTKFLINGKETGESLKVTANIKDDFSQMTQEQTKKAGYPVIDRSYFEFGEVKSGKMIDAVYTIRNTGASDLVIHKVESQSPGIMIMTPYPLTIKKGSSTQFKVRLNTTRLDGEVLAVLTAITNTPSKPMFNLFITGNVLN